MQKRRKEDLVDTNQAIKMIQNCGVGCTRTSLITWIEKYELGKKVGGRWYVDPVKLMAFLEGENG